jgi:hypothetical protein
MNDATADKHKENTMKHDDMKEQVVTTLTRDYVNRVSIIAELLCESLVGLTGKANATAPMPTAVCISVRDALLSVVRLALKHGCLSMDEIAIPDVPLEKEPGHEVVERESGEKTGAVIEDGEAVASMGHADSPASQASEADGADGADEVVKTSHWDEEIRDALRHYSPFQAKRILKRLRILLDSMARLNRNLGVPVVRLKDLRQLFPVVLAPVLNDDEKVNLVCRLYSELARQPGWTTRGNVGWIQRQIEAAISISERTAGQNSVMEREVRIAA